MKRRQRQEEEQRVAGEIQRLSNELFYSSGSPILGNPKGTVNLVFFFDYQCTYCKQMAGMLVERLKNERNVRIVMKRVRFWVLKSFMMAQAALAARKQGKCAKSSSGVDGQPYPFDNPASAENCRKPGDQP